MKIKLRVKVVMPFLFLALIYGHGWGQESSKAVAKIRKIAVADLPGDKPRNVKKTSRVQIRRQNRPMDAERNSPLYFQDLIELQKFTRVRLGVNQPFQEINLVFLTASVKDSVVTLRDKGTYEIRNEPEGSTQIAIDIYQGSSIIEVLKGKLNVNSGRLRSIMSSSSTTRAVVVVNPDSSGLVYLDRGRTGAVVFPDSVSFPDSVKGHLRAGQVARFRQGRVIQIKHISLLVVATAVLPSAAKLSSLVKYNNKTIWSKVWWQRPEFLIPAAAAVSGGVVATLVAGGNGGQSLPEPPPLPPKP